VRILQQCIYFPPEVGGLESHAFYLCRELVRLGHYVTMVTSRSRPGLPRRETMDGIEVVRKWFPRKRAPAGWAAHTLGTRWHYLRLARHADVLHAQTFASALPGMAARRKFGKPLVLTLHTSHFLRLAFGGRRGAPSSGRSSVRPTGCWRRARRYVTSRWSCIHTRGRRR
jgi:glycosyltransferase involved in cell wall biosynthesis